MRYLYTCPTSLLCLLNRKLHGFTLLSKCHILIGIVQRVFVQKKYIKGVHNFFSFYILPSSLLSLHSISFKPSYFVITIGYCQRDGKRKQACIFAFLFQMKFTRFIYKLLVTYLVPVQYYVLKPLLCMFANSIKNTIFYNSFCFIKIPFPAKNAHCNNKFV